MVRTGIDGGVEERRVIGRVSGRRDGSWGGWICWPGNHHISDTKDLMEHRCSYTEYSVLSTQYSVINHGIDARVNGSIVSPDSEEISRRRDASINKCDIPSNSC